MLPYATVSRAISLLLLLATGCSVLSPGDSEFSCPRTAGGVGCLSARQVYLATETTDAVTAPPSAGKAGTETPLIESGQEPGPSCDGDARMELDRLRSPVRKVAVADYSAATARQPCCRPPAPDTTAERAAAGTHPGAGDAHLDGALGRPGRQSVYAGLHLHIEPRRWQQGLPSPDGKAEPQPLQIDARIAAEPPGAPAAGLSGFLKDPRRLSDRKP